jgi:histone H4
MTKSAAKLLLSKAKRHRKAPLRAQELGITQGDIRRLARRGGVKRISGLVYDETRGVLRGFLENVLRDAVAYTEHARRQTVTAVDVLYALKRQGRALYGVGSLVPPEMMVQTAKKGQRQRERSEASEAANKQGEAGEANEASEANKARDEAKGDEDAGGQGADGGKDSQPARGGSDDEREAEGRDEDEQAAEEEEEGGQAADTIFQTQQQQPEGEEDEQDEEEDDQGKQDNQREQGEDVQEPDEAVAETILQTQLQEEQREEGEHEEQSEQSDRDQATAVAQTQVQVDETQPEDLLPPTIGSQASTTSGDSGVGRALGIVPSEREQRLQRRQREEQREEQPQRPRTRSQAQPREQRGAKRRRR